MSMVVVIVSSRFNEAPAKRGGIPAKQLETIRRLTVASMRPPRNAGEYDRFRAYDPAGPPGFNEAPAKRGGIRGSGTAPARSWSCFNEAPAKRGGIQLKRGAEIAANGVLQ